MVGLTCRWSTGDDHDEQFSETLQPLLHTDRLDATVVTETDRKSVGYTAYPEYPIERYETTDLLICFEGRLYDREGSIEDELVSIAKAMLADDPPPVKLRDWLLSVDGEFLLLACHKESGRLAILNDALGRLPTYFHHDETTFVASRELRYVIEQVEAAFDKLGVAQCLLFGYSLGDRTIIRDANRLRPGTLLTVDDRTGGSGIEISETTLHSFDFDDHRHADRSRERNARELVSLFTEACQNRAGYYDHDVISLSGGLDSRSVLAGYHATGERPEVATMTSRAYVPGSDVAVARQLVDDFDVDWHTYEIGHPSGRDLDTLVKTKNGQIGLITSYILEFFRDLQADFGTSLAYVTGDGGDKALPDLTPAKSIDDGELVDYILTENSVMDIEWVAKVTGMPEERIRDSIREHVDTYPERSPEGKYVHFLLYERGVNFLFEGEERNRLFFWSVTPFYSLPFFRYAMNCPPGQKQRYKLYREFLRQLAPSAARRNHPTYGVPVNSSRHAIAALVDDILSRYPTVFETVKPIIKSINDRGIDGTTRTDTVDLIRAQVDRNEAVEEIFDRAALTQFIDAHSEYDKFTLYRVFAITSVVDDLHSSQSLLETHGDTVFA